MGSVLHGCARTTPRIRAELQASQESSRTLAARYGLDPKTVRKWRGRITTSDAPMGPKAPKSTVLTPAEEAIVVEFRRRTLLPLDDVLGCLSLPSDILAEACMLPPLSVGDVLAFPNAGAYGLMASPALFHGHPVPAEVAFDGDSLQVLRVRLPANSILGGQVVLHSVSGARSTLLEGTCR